MSFVRAVAACARRHPAAAVVTVAGLLVLGGFGFATGVPATPSYLGTVVTAVVVVATADERVRFGTPVLAALAAWGVAHLAGGLVTTADGRTIYALVVGGVHVDNLVHFAGFGAAGYACWEALRRHLPSPPPRATAWLVVWLAAMGVGALNEVAEFAATHLIGAANVGGYQNTGRDLVANMLGGAVAGALAAYRPAARAR